jgi:hypothetical protein
MANMISKAKDLYKMQREAKAMQGKMRQVTVLGHSKDDLVEIQINGANELDDIDIDEELLQPAKKQKLEKSIIEAFKDATKRLQKELLKDMDLDKMKSMLGM